MYAIFELKLGGSYETDEATHTYIDNMHIDELNTVNPYHFGTMRSSDSATPGIGLHFWRLKRNCGYLENVWDIGFYELSPCFSN